MTGEMKHSDAELDTGDPEVEPATGPDSEIDLISPHLGAPVDAAVAANLENGAPEEVESDIDQGP
jgi:hypothetical protein